MRSYRKLLWAAPAALLSLALMAPAIEAAPATTGVPGTGFNTAFRIQNLGTAPANCSYSIYDNTGASVYNITIGTAVAVGDSAYVYTGDTTLNPPFPTGTNAGTISCTQPVAAVVNFSNATSGDSYVGTTNPANTLYVPSAYSNFYNYQTSFRIQNAGAAAQTVTVKYFAPGATSPAATVSVSLPLNGAATVDQAGQAGLNNNVSYSAQIIGTDKLAATVAIFGAPGSAVSKQLYAFSAFANGATTVYAPVIMRNYYGYNTATTIQNIGTAAANVTLTYSNGVAHNYTIAAASSQVVSDYLDTGLTDPHTLYASKIVSTNGQPLIVTVNESTPGTNRATTYEGLSQGGTTLVAPITLKGYYGYNSSLTCQNVGSAATNVNATFAGAGSTITNQTVLTNLQPGAAGIIYQPSQTGLNAGYIGSATLTSPQPIVCVVNQDENLAPQVTQVADFLAAYDAIVHP